MNQDRAHKSVWFVYIASLLTPFTCLLSGVIGIIYAGYRLDKNQDGEVANSHYYGLIRSFFLYLTFFVVLIVTVATTNGIIMGVNRYWMPESWLAKLGHGIPYVGAIIAVGAISIWIWRMIQGMQQYQNNLPHSPSKGPNL
ncbi:membrane protein [Vibrio metoecus]|nr:membrane protein [Vibrio metoecus]